MRNGFKFDDIFRIFCEFRRYFFILVILMIYYNLVFRMGVKKFFGEVKVSGVDGIFVVDFFVSYVGEFFDVVKEEGLKIVFFVVLNIFDERFREIDKVFIGFVYFIFLYGIIGVCDRFFEMVFEFVRCVRKICNNKLVVGFGVLRRE